MPEGHLGVKEKHLNWHVFAEEMLPEVFRFLDLLGVLCNGIIGGRLARRKKFDAIGLVVLAVMSATGGGIVRDVMLQTVPVALTDPYYLSTALIGALIAFLWRMESKWSSRLIVVADGLVLGTWAATGAIKTLQFGHGVLAALMLGLITAVGGGMIRDIASGSVPLVFGGNSLYATPALGAAFAMVAFYKLNLPMTGMIVATLLGATVAVAAHWKRWTLPDTTDWTVTVSAAQLARILRRAAIRPHPDLEQALKDSEQRNLPGEKQA